ncbi:hypothetical protein Acr_29g0002700 [Actinidia rufa]|uniref:Uncharacterized protein n=1 Tax=Actinidia rufa TaxID=165716 RepID=A0A7J0HDG9_9ERIC|nr:hypothetical protein Acr_29g0002700 [Actinidia rufa]
MLNRRRNRVIPTAEPKALVEPIPIFGSDVEHSNDLTYNPLQLVWNKTLGQKKSQPTVDPPTALVPPISQVPLLALALVLALTAQARVEPSSLESPLIDKRAQAELWKPEFFTVELGKQKRAPKNQGLVCDEVVQVSILTSAKLDSKAAEKVKLDLATIQNRDASYDVVTKTPGEVATVQEQLDKALG